MTVVNGLSSPSAADWSTLSWSAAELQQRGTWLGQLPAAVREELLEFVARYPHATDQAFEWLPAQWPCLVSFGEQVKKQLLTVDGLFCLQGLGPLGLANSHLRCFYIAFGCALGQPMLQYGRLYPVIDRGASYKTQSIPVSMTNAETCFHTDSSAVDVVPDFVGLLCEEPSHQGGDSLVSNAFRVYQILQRQFPQLLAALRRDKYRDVVTPHLPKTYECLLRNRFPIYSASDGPGGVLFRYMRYWIETGHHKLGKALDGIEVEAMDRLDALLQDQANFVKLHLERGDILWVNNRLLAHNRTAYKDSPGNIRQLQRMWICQASCPS